MDWFKELLKNIVAPAAIGYGVSRLSGSGPAMADPRTGGYTDPLGSGRPGLGMPSMPNRGLGIATDIGGMASTPPLGFDPVPGDRYGARSEAASAPPEEAGRFGFFGDVLGYMKERPELVLKLLEMYGTSKAQAREDKYVEEEMNRRREEQARRDRVRRRVAGNIASRRGLGSAPDLRYVFNDPGDPYARTR